MVWGRSLISANALLIDLSITPMFCGKPRATTSCRILPARRCASAGNSYGNVSVSVTSRSSVETAEGIEPVFARRFLSAYPTLHFEEIRISPKGRVLLSETLPQTLDLENFSTACRSSKRVIYLARQRWTLGV